MSRRQISPARQTLDRLKADERAARKRAHQRAKKMKWRDIHLSGGNVVTAETSREIFQDAEKALKSKSRRKRAHAAVS